MPHAPQYDLKGRTRYESGRIYCTCEEWQSLIWGLARLRIVGFWPLLDEFFGFIAVWYLLEQFFVVKPFEMSYNKWWSLLTIEKHNPY